MTPFDLLTHAVAVVTALTLLVWTRTKLRHMVGFRTTAMLRTSLRVPRVVSVTKRNL